MSDARSRDEMDAEQLAADFAAAQQMIRSGDTAGLAKLANRSGEQRATAAAAAATRFRPHGMGIVGEPIICSKCGRSSPCRNYGPGCP